MTIVGRMLLGIAGFLLLLAVVYWLLSYEEAGSVLLLLAAGLAFVSGGYLFATTRRGREPDPAGEAHAGGSAPGGEGDGAEARGADALYLPHASIWPFGVGAGSVVLANGLALGLWAVVPGSILLAASMVGYALQSRNRG